MFGSDGGDNPGGNLGGVEFGDTLDGSRERGLGVRCQGHRHYCSLTVRLTTGCYSTDRDLGESE